MTTLQPGADLERYTVQRVLGQGGMAIVYEVRHQRLNSRHALKLLHRTAPEIQQRLALEGTAQSSLRHPNIVPVTDIIEHNGALGLIMNYVDGPTLEEHLRSGPMPAEEADAVAEGLLRGLNAAHEAGIVHRDLKPANILLTRIDGRLTPQIADFGLAKVLDDSETGTRTGLTMGTPQYMAPEQIRDSSRVDQRADIFSLGCILYEMFCGQPPFSGTDRLALFNRIASGDFTPPDALCPDLPEHIHIAILGAMEVDPEYRTASCEELLALWSAQSLPPMRAHTPRSLPPQSTTLPPLEESPTDSTLPPIAPSVLPPTSMLSPAPTPPPPRRARAVAAAAGLLVAVLVWQLWPEQTAPREPAPVADPPAVTPDDIAVEEAVPVEPAPVSAPAPGEAARSPSTHSAPPAAALPETAKEPALPDEPDAQTTGTVQVTGEARVFLRSIEGQFSPGDVPPGTYAVWASFNGEPPIPSGSITLEASEQIQLICDAQFQDCRSSTP